MTAKIDDLLPSVAVKCRKWLAACKAEGLNVRVTSTYRSYAEQNAIYAQGRTKPGKIVTYARGGDSWHNHRRAFDFVVINNGKADWNDLASFKKAQAIGKKFGLEGLNFELAHLQDRGGMTIKQAKAKAKAGGEKEEPPHPMTQTAPAPITRDELKAKGSRTITAVDKGAEAATGAQKSVIGGASAAVGVDVLVSKASSLNDAATSAMDTVERGQSIMDWLLAHWQWPVIVVLTLIALYFFWRSYKLHGSAKEAFGLIEFARVDDANTGVHLGRVE